MNASTVPSLPQTMQAMRFHAPGDLRYETLPLPQLEPGDILVQIEQALTCGTDLKCFRRGHPVLLASLPSPFGHEFAGHVVAVTPQVTTVQVGDRVVCANSAPCGHCFFCEKKQPNLCENLELLNGAYAQFIRVPAPIVSRNTYRLPDGMSAQVAAFTEPLAVSIRGVDGLNVSSGERVAIIGLGPIGQLMVKVAKLRGAHVTAMARTAHKLAMAQSFGGADAVANIAQGLDPAGLVADLTPQGRGFDAVIEAVGLPETWEAAVALARRGGRVHWFAGCPGDSTVTLSTRRLHYDEITCLSLFHHTPAEVRQAFEWLRDGVVDPRPLITETYPLSEVETALTRMADGLAFKLAINPA